MATHLKNLSDFSHLEIPSAKPYKIGIVVSMWNAEITGALLEGAVDLLLANKLKEENLQVIQVPGSYELTSGADLLYQNSGVDAVICLGCVIQGDTRHFDFICQAVSQGLTQVSLKHNKPVIFGVLTTDNQQQALDRAGGKYGNKGEEAAVTAIHMAALQARLKDKVSNR